MGYPSDRDFEDARSGPTRVALTLSEFQRNASRTIPEGFSDAQTLDIGKDNLWEAGEAANILKKHLKHGHDLDAVNKSDVKGRTYRQCLYDELGDVLWAVATICTGAGFDLGKVAEANVEKLRKRYPAGFDPERSKNRADEAPAHPCRVCGETPPKHMDNCGPFFDGPRYQRPGGGT